MNIIIQDDSHLLFFILSSHLIMFFLSFWMLYKKIIYLQTLKNETLC